MTRREKDRTRKKIRKWLNYFETRTVGSKFGFKLLNHHGKNGYLLEVPQ